MGQLVINSIQYQGDKYYYKSPELNTGINIIEGENGNGKSTLMHMIYYCLGGTVPSFDKGSKSKHELITKDSNNYVELNINIDKNRYILRRKIGYNFISISDKNGNVETYSINRVENPEIFSDWLLGKLGIHVLDIFQGTSSFKLNIKDLFRLIYHDQNPDPKKIFKAPDHENQFSDSEYVRKLIFRVLLGKTFEGYYAKIGALKNAESEKKSAQSVYDEFKRISIELYPEDSEILNVPHLDQKLGELNGQLTKLLRQRTLLKILRPPTNESAWKEVESAKQKIQKLELESINIKDSLNKSSDERYKLNEYRSRVIKEVTQLNKIIHTHESLNIFSTSSCPFCLGTTERTSGKCYCGNSVNEESFERLFLSTAEYWDLLKSRKKSVETIDLVIEDVNKSISDNERNLETIDSEIESLKSEIEKKLNTIDEVGVDLNLLDKVDDKILAVKNELQDLNRKHDFETSLAGYKSKLDAATDEYKKLYRELDALEQTAEQEMQSTLLEFNTIYNRLMTSTLKECRSANIDADTYDAVIDGGMYREASSRVATRFNYFLTILLLSMQRSEVKFPRFLLVDTPQTAGIDREQLKKLFDQIPLASVNFQVILTTGKDLYPTRLKPFVIEELTDQNKLLKSR